ncbi:hypothetical protein SDC9_158061 [bioreactor metagenome]|uniref:Peptidase M50 domain-containing protein n=1 Tax=bioreactor metagenome TaxID=1076179 RepID=A0A645FE45_9ZZZZ
MGLAAFNLLPIPPLDGSRVLYVMLPYKYLHVYYTLEKYGMFVIVALMILGVIPVLMSPIMNLILSIIL